MSEGSEGPQLGEEDENAEDAEDENEDVAAVSSPDGLGNLGRAGTSGGPSSGARRGRSSRSCHEELIYRSPPRGPGSSNVNGMTSPLDSSLQLAERTGAHARVATLVGRTDVSPSLVQVTLEGDVEALAGRPGQDVMILVDEGRPSLRRRYSVRRVDPAAGTMDLWIQSTHNGPGAAWAREADLGSRVDVVGPRGKIFLDPLADWHLFVGHISALGAFYSLAESIETPGRALFVVETEDPADAVTTSFSDELGVTGVFVDRAGRSANDPAGLLAALASLELPADEGHAYVFAEFHATRVVRSALLDRGLAESAISHKAYFRVGLANRDQGEPLKDE